jgi:hypothetical protein
MIMVATVIIVIMIMVATVLIVVVWLATMIMAHLKTELLGDIWDCHFRDEQKMVPNYM